jgi:hypothetical protein
LKKPPTEEIDLTKSANKTSDDLSKANNNAPLNLPKTLNNSNQLNSIKKDYQTTPIDYQTAIVRKK